MSVKKNLTKVKIDNTPVIYKQDIMNDDGKLNFVGTLLVVGICLVAINSAFQYLSDCLVDKDKVN